MLVVDERDNNNETGRQMKNGTEYKTTIQTKDPQHGFKVNASVARVDEEKHMAWITLLEGPGRGSTYSIDIRRVIKK